MRNLPRLPPPDVRVWTTRSSQRYRIAMSSRCQTQRPGSHKGSLHDEHSRYVRDDCTDQIIIRHLKDKTLTASCGVLQLLIRLLGEFEQSQRDEEARREEDAKLEDLRIDRNEVRQPNACCGSTQERENSCRLVGIEG